MTSVTKLVLVPMHKWKNIVRDRKDMNNVKTVEVPMSVQKGLGPKASDSPALLENKKQQASPSQPLPSPVPSPRGKEEGEGEGEGRERSTYLGKIWEWKRQQMQLKRRQECGDLQENQHM